MEKSIGKLIEEELRNQQRGATWLAKQLNCNRQNVYDIFKRSNIDVELLQRISVILQRNFFAEINQDTDTIIKGV